MNCTQCGAPARESALFCDRCGTPLFHPEVSQPPMNTPPVKYAPIAEPDPCAPEPATHAPVKKKKIWPIVCIIVLVLAAALAVFLVLTANQTVYLIGESSTYTSNGIETIIRQEYNDDGRLISLKRTTKYPENFGAADYLHEICYEYDDDGLLVGAELEFGYKNNETETIEVKYTYDDGVLDKVKVDRDSDIDYNISLTDDGKIKRIKVVVSEYSEMTYTYRYHDNGKLKSLEYEFKNEGYSRSSYAYIYDELGRQIEYTYYWDGQPSTKQVYGYIEEGTLMNRIEVYNYTDGEETSAIICEIEAEKDGNTVTGLTAKIDAEIDGEAHEAEISGSVEWDGLEATWTAEEFTGDMEDMKLPEDFDLDDITLVYEFDEAGNLIQYSITYQDTELMGGEVEYIELKLPRSYVRPSMIDPLISLSWLG